MKNKKTYWYYFVFSVVLYLLSFLLLSLWKTLVYDGTFGEYIKLDLFTYFDVLHDLFTYQKLRYIALVFVAITVFVNILCYKKLNKFTISLMFLCNNGIWGVPFFGFVYFFILVITGSFWF